MAAVGPQMHGDRICPCCLCRQGGGQDRGLRIGGVWHGTVARLTQGHDMVNIDSEEQVGLGHVRYVAQAFQPASTGSKCLFHKFDEKM